MAMRRGQLVQHLPALEAAHPSCVVAGLSSRRAAHLLRMPFNPMVLPLALLCSFSIICVSARICSYTRGTANCGVWRPGAALGVCSFKQQQVEWATNHPHQLLCSAPP